MDPHPRSFGVILAREDDIMTAHTPELKNSAQESDGAVAHPRRHLSNGPHERFLSARPGAGEYRQCGFHKRRLSQS